MNSFLTALHSMFNDLKGCWRSLLQTMNGYSLALFLVSATSLLTSPLAPAQPSGTAQNSEIITVFGGENILRWYGHAGRSYFIQSSDQNNPLGKWKWAPLIEAGNNAPITHEVGNIGDKAFFRLKYTDQVPGPGKTLDTADFDRDGISNLNEIVPPSPLLASDATDPLDADTDHDGLPDGWERENRINANDNGTGNPNNGHNGDADNDGLTNSQEFALGTNPNNQDSDSDGIPDAWEALNGLDPTTQTDPSAIGPINLV